MASKLASAATWADVKGAVRHGWEGGDDDGGKRERRRRQARHPDHAV